MAHCCQLHKQDIRNLFGVSNFQYSIINTLFGSTTSLATQKQLIAQCLSKQPELAHLFEPLYELYYDGPMGGYGENLKSKQVGFGVKTISAIRDVLKRRQIDVPVIATQQEFERFIDETPYMMRRIVLIKHGAVMSTELTGFRDEDEHIYSAVYEKHQHSDVLYLYNSGLDDINIDKVRLYFRPHFKLFIANDFRLSFNTVGLQAIEDARRLKNKIQPKIIEEMDLHLIYPHAPLENSFQLSKEFIYDEQALMDEHVQTMIHLVTSNKDEGCLDILNNSIMNI